MNNVVAFFSLFLLFRSKGRRRSSRRRRRRRNTRRTMFVIFGGPVGALDASEQSIKCCGCHPAKWNVEPTMEIAAILVLPIAHIETFKGGLSSMSV